MVSLVPEKANNTETQKLVSHHSKINWKNLYFVWRFVLLVEQLNQPYHQTAGQMMVEGGQSLWLHLHLGRDWNKQLWFHQIPNIFKGKTLPISQHGKLLTQVWLKQFRQKFKKIENQTYMLIGSPYPQSPEAMFGSWKSQNFQGNCSQY